MGHEGVYAMTPISTLAHHTGSQSTDGSHLGGSIGRGSSLSRTSLGEKSFLCPTLYLLLCKFFAAFFKV